LDKINVCQHRLSECTCLQAYDLVVFTAVHSAYYFQQADFQAALSPGNTDGTATIYAAFHLPQLGSGVPEDAPEYRWISGYDCDSLPWYDKMHWAVRDVLTGESPVAFTPVDTNGTVYLHGNLPWVHAGGIHSSPVSRAVQACTGRFWCAALISVGWTALSAQTVYTLWALLHWLWVTLFYSEPMACQYIPRLITGSLGYCLVTKFPLTLVIWTLAGWVSACAAITFCRFFLYPSADPGLSADFTVRVENGTDIVHRESRETHASCLRLVIGKPGRIERRVVEGVRIDPEAARWALSSTLLQGATSGERIENRLIGAITRRMNLTSSIAANSVGHAMARAEALSGNGVPVCRRTSTHLVTATLWPLTLLAKCAWDLGMRAIWLMAPVSACLLVLHFATVVTGLNPVLGLWVWLSSVVGKLPTV
jgi:hypothetical protein